MYWRFLVSHRYEFDITVLVYGVSRARFQLKYILNIFISHVLCTKEQVVNAFRGDHINPSICLSPSFTSETAK